MFTEVHCTVVGKVQGVAYRDFAQRIARNKEITGWIQNKTNGTVEILAQGTPDSLKAFVEELHEGSVLARVETVAVEWQSPETIFEDFIVIYK